MRSIIVLVLFVGILPACDDAGVSEEDAFQQRQQGGDMTFYDRSSNAYTNPSPNLNDQEFDLHTEGDAVFEATFVSAPADINPGLGPVYNNNACSSCHIKNGRGLPVIGNGPLQTQLLVRVSQTEGDAPYPGAPIPVPGIGDQIGDHGIYGQEPEALIELSWTEEPGIYPDGTPFSLRRPIVDVTWPDGSALPEGVMLSLRLPPPIFGLGLLEAISEDEILSRADPDDLDGDGISGRPNLVWDHQAGEERLGRFSWKANAPSLMQQTALAYKDDMGVSNPMFPDSDGSMDIDKETMTAATFYTQTLAVPARDAYGKPKVIEGQALFNALGCSSCHVSKASSSADHEIEALRSHTFYPYTDLLLHDMGEGLADDRPDYRASGQEWRTSPLWGIGLVETVLGAKVYLHDGRARSLEEAILWHGGEAKSSRDAFTKLERSDREALFAFLRSL